MFRMIELDSGALAIAAMPKVRIKSKLYMIMPFVKLGEGLVAMFSKE